MTTRFDLYTDIHKALRTMLFDVAAKAGRCNFDDPAELGLLQDEFGLLCGVIEEHTQHEERFVHPHIVKFEPALAAALDAEHERSMADLTTLQTTLAAIVPTAQDVVSRGNTLYRQYCAWLGDFLIHMNEEETVIMPALQAHLDDGQLMCISLELRGAIEPERMGMYLSKMIPAMNGSECTALFLGMKMGAPQEVYEGTLQLAKQVLSRPAFHRLSASLD